MADILKIRFETDGEGKVKASIAGIEQQLDKQEKQVKQTARSWVNLNTVMSVVSVATAVAIIQQTDAYNVLQQRIRTATKVTGDYATVSSELEQISKRNGAALADTVSVFQNLARSSKELGATNTDVLQVVDAVQQLGVIGGASQSAMSAGLMQFSQGLAAGVFRAEEFNSIVENLPEVAARIAGGMNMTTGQLRNAVLAGKVLSQDVFQALLKQAPQIAKEFQDIERPVSAAGQSMQNSVAGFLSRLDQASGTTRGIVSGMEAISDALDNASGTQVLDTLQGLSMAVGGLLAARAVGPILAAITVEVVGLTRGSIALNAALLTTVARNQALAASGRALRSMLALVGGPGGLALLAGGGLLYFATSASRAKGDISDLRDEVDGLLGKMDQLTERQTKDAADRLEESIRQQQNNIIGLLNQPTSRDARGNLLSWAKTEALALHEALDADKQRLEELRQKLAEPATQNASGAGKPNPQQQDLDKFRDGLLKTQLESEQLADKVAILDGLMLDGAISTDIWTAALEKLTGAQAGLKAQARDDWDDVLDLYIEEEKQNQDRWARNKAGVKEASDDAQRFAKSMDSAVTGWASNFSASLTEAVWGADASFDKIAESFGKMLTQMVIQYKIVEPMLGSFGIGPQATPATPAVSAPTTGSAHGNIFSGGAVQAFAAGGAFTNSVVSNPTIAPMALFGEAGPEAIMPLKRLPNGDLGIQAQGGGGGGTVVQIIDQRSADAPAAEVSSSRGADGSELLKVVIKEVKQGLSGGVFDRELSSNFGVRRQGH